MVNFKKINLVLHYIDENLHYDLNYQQVAEKFHYSSYYFHRLFTTIVGKTITEYIRDRRLEKACKLLAYTNHSIISICFDCGFNSSQSFSRIFRKSFGIPPSVYRKKGIVPESTSVESLIFKFTNRIKGGIYLNPRIIKKGELLIAGITGDGSKTAEIWQQFEKANPKPAHTEENGYEVRIYDEDHCICHVGFRTENKKINKPFQLLTLPESKYAVFDVYVSRGYESENKAMDEWLETNEEGYKQRFYNGKPYVVEFYDERFTGDESIVEIWVPIEK